MNWQQWTLLALIVLSAMATISNIGKPRSGAPLASNAALLALAIDAFAAVLVVYA